MKKCAGCFELIRDDLEVCPFCGYIEGSAPDEVLHLFPGTILADRYIIGRVLGFGGFGVTYIGWDRILEQKIAIKEYLPSEFSTRMPGNTTVTVFGGVREEQYEDGLEKFSDEAKRLSKFQQEDGIVRVYDCIFENGTAYIIMEYLEGEPLSELLKRESVIPEERAIDILMPVMNSLDVVHKSGIIHRDISPDNIFLLNDGRVKLIDFGAARYATTSHSRSLTVIIKPGYSAEEQYRSHGDQGPHTDVYSLAAVLYKMLTGETPPDALERRARIENAKKDNLIEPRKINSDITPISENAILNALNIRIEDRTPTIQDFISDLMSDVPVKRKRGKIRKANLYGLPMWIKISVPVLLAVFVIFGILMATGVLLKSAFRSDIDVPDGYVEIPNTEGLEAQEAIDVLEECGLSYSTGGNTIVDYVPADTIVYQTPESGRMLPIGSRVELVVSKGSGEIVLPSNGMSTIPTFLWSEEESAIEDFTTAGLVTMITYVYDENVTEGQIVGVIDTNENQLSTGDQIPEGSTVILQEAVNTPISEGLDYELLDDGTISITGRGECADENIIIPSIINGYQVSNIGLKAFLNDRSLLSVNLPDTIECINSFAFAGCTNLTTIILPEGLNQIGYDAFAYCINLNGITIPSGVTIISPFAFADCHSLETIELPSGLRSVSSGVFYNCSSLSNVVVPSGVNSINTLAFCRCSSLQSINLPSTVITVNEFAFGQCSNLTSVVVPDGVCDYMAFEDCPNLEIDQSVYINYRWYYSRTPDLSAYDPNHIIDRT